MELFLVYLWLKLDGLLIVCWTSFISSLIIYSIIGAAGRLGEQWDINPTEVEKKLIKSHNRLGIFVLISGIFTVFLPSSRDTAILIGTSIAIDMKNSPEGQKVSQLIRKKANDFLDEQLNEVKK